jgi:hypothetical protein
LPSGQVRGNGIYEVATGVVRQLNDDAGSYIAGWMPESKRLVYLTTSGTLMIQDIDTLKRHEIDVAHMPPPDRYLEIAIAPDGRTIYYGAQQVEANIWKVEQPKTANK